MSGLLPAKAKKKKRTHEDQQNLKRVKLEINGNGANNTLPFENTLSIPIQEALSKFREASEQELIRLRKEGMDPSAAINRLVEKMRTIEGDVQPSFTRQEIELVMEIAGINEEGATRALILRSELAKLRHDGFNHPEAINELSRRMKKLAGSKRRVSTSAERVEGKHRRKDSLSASTRVSFTQLDTLSNPSLTLEPPPIGRKRHPDALMLDEDQHSLLRKRQKYDREDKDSSDSDDSGSDEEHYSFHDDVGEFSQDEKDLRDEESDSDDGISPFVEVPLASYSPLSDEEYNKDIYDDTYHKDTDMDGELEDGLSTWSERSLIFQTVKEEESDSDDAWQLPTRTTSRTTTSTSTTSSTTTTTTTTSPTISPLDMFSTSSPSPPRSPPSPPTRTHPHIGSKSTKRRDSPSTKVISHRTIS
jgi:hypothetical protein